MEEKIYAVVGVSKNPDKYGNKIFSAFLKKGYEVYGINLKGGEILDQKIYASLTDVYQKINKKIDTVVLVIQPEKTSDIVDEIIKLGIKEVYFQPGSENQTAVEKAKKAGVNAITSCFLIAHNM